MTAEMFKDKVLRHSDRMWKVAVAVLRDPDAAQDAVQDALVRLWENRHKIAASDDAGSYCMAVVRNVAVDMFRHRAVTSAGSIDGTFQIPSSDLSPDSILHGTQSAEIIDRLISTLSPDQQTVIRLSSYDGCDMAEIRRVTGFSAENVRTLLSRARRKLRDLYQQVVDTQ